MRALSLVVAAVMSISMLLGAEVAVSRPPEAGAASASLPPPAAANDPTLPPLPPQSPRNASYTIEARLDPEQHTIQGSLVLEWRNLTGQPQATFPFHLYWNAFRNSLSTSARGEGRRAARARGAGESRGFGYIQVSSVRQAGLESAAEADLTSTLR